MYVLNKIIEAAGLNVSTIFKLREIIYNIGDKVEKIELDNKMIEIYELQRMKMFNKTFKHIGIDIHTEDKDVEIIVDVENKNIVLRQCNIIDKKKLTWISYKFDTEGNHVQTKASDSDIID